MLPLDRLPSPPSPPTLGRAPARRPFNASFWALAALACLGCDAFDAGRVAGLTEAVNCVGARPPGRPTGGTGDDGNEYVIVLRDILLDQEAGGGDDAAWRSIGFNLDGRCTTLDEPDVECEPVRPIAVPTDGHDGIDNAFGGRFYPILRLGAPDIQMDLRTNQARGVGAVVLRIRGWNGEPDDDQVEVTVTQSVFATPAAPDGCRPAVDVVGTEGFIAGTQDPVPLPQWLGEDYFWVRDDTFVTDDRPLVVTTNGYVAGGIITASLPDQTPILLVGTEVGARVAMTDLTAQGDIYSLFNGPVDGHLPVIVSGRWARSDILANAENVGVCPDGGLLNLLTPQIETMVDVLTNPEDAEPGAPCDALSLGVSFEAYIGRWGGIAGSPPLPTPCEAP